MSKTFTSSRPGVATRGRGRGRGNYQPTLVNNPETGPENSAKPKTKVTPKTSQNMWEDEMPQTEPRARAGAPEPAGDSPTRNAQDRMQRREAYTVIAPDETRRTQISQQAKKEEEEYEKYKEGRKLKHVNYVGTVSGSPGTKVQSESTARSRAMQNQRQANLDRKMKSQDYKVKQKQDEEKEIAAKKAAARLKAEDNKKKEADRQVQLQPEHKLKNEAFLARVEREGRQKQLAKKTSSHHPEQSTAHNDNPFAALQRPSGSGDDVQGAGAAINRSPVHQLIELYPQLQDYDENVLEDILVQTNGSISQAAQLLLDL